MKGNFLSFLQKTAPEAFNYEKICARKYSRVSVDVSIYLNKYKSIHGQSWRRHFVSFLQFFKNANIMLYCVFDGIAPIEKKPEREQRKRNKQRVQNQICEIEEAVERYKIDGTVAQILIDLHKNQINSFLLPSSALRLDLIDAHLKKIKRNVYRLTSEDYDWVVEEMFKMDFFVMTARTEAEKVCAQLCKNGTAAACLSDDSDLLGYFCPVILSKFNLATKSSKVVNFEILLAKLELTSHEFLDFCIMCGTDFNKNITGIGPANAYEHIKKHKSIENFATKTKIDVSILNHIRVRQLYLQLV